MIVVTVEIPVMEIKYDFRIDEDIPFCFVRDEITELICRRNQCPLDGAKNKIMVWEKKRGTIIDIEKTAYENGLITGSELVMA